MTQHCPNPPLQSGENRGKGGDRRIYAFFERKNKVFPPFSKGG